MVAWDRFRRRNHSTNLSWNRKGGEADLNCGEPEGGTPHQDRFIAGWRSLAAHVAHNHKVVGSNPTPATNFMVKNHRVVRENPSILVDELRML